MGGIRFPMLFLMPVFLQQETAQHLATMPL